MIVPAKLAFTEKGTPYSPDYDDIYHSESGALEQARHVFIKGNELPARWRGRESFVIVETGFGLGLNFLAAWQAWADDPERCSRLSFVSFEQRPFVAADLAQAHRRWPQLAALAGALQAQWPVLAAGAHRLDFAAGRVSLTLFLGDATRLLPQLMTRADACFLDGFAPAKNPELWSAKFLSALTRLASPGATLATWSVAGDVREALAAAGWKLERRPGFGHKREMLCGTLPGSRTATQISRSAMIIGAGIAGSSLAERLAARGWTVSLVDRQLGPALEGSGMPGAILLPLPAKDDNRVARISRAAFLHATRRLRELAAQPAASELRWEPAGVVQIARDAGHEALQRQTVDNLGLPDEYIRFLERQEIATLLGRPAALGGWYFPGGGWLCPSTLCRTLLAGHANINQRYATTVGSMTATAEGWLARDAAGRPLGEATQLIFANAQDALRFLPELPLQKVRGQISCLPMASFRDIKQAVCSKSYLIPNHGAGHDGIAYLGASFDLNDEETALRQSSHEENLAGLEAMLPGASRGISAANLPGRVGFRSMSPDRLPLAGQLPVNVGGIRSDLPLAAMERQRGLHCLLGLGARGMVWAPLLAELLAAQLEGEPLPLERDLVAALDPARFLFRKLRRS